METVTMPPDMSEKITQILVELATLIERSANTAARLENLENKVEVMIAQNVDFRTDMENKMSNIKRELGRYSVVAAIGISVMIFVVQEFLGK
jgi:hypothetical protein